MKYLRITKNLLDDMEVTITRNFRSDVHIVRNVEELVLLELDKIPFRILLVEVNNFRFSVCAKEAEFFCKIENFNHNIEFSEQLDFMTTLNSLNNRLFRTGENFTYEGPDITINDFEYSLPSIVNQFADVSFNIVLSEWSVDLSVYSIEFLRENKIIVRKDEEIILNFTYTNGSLRSLCIMLIAVMENYEK